ncbi:type I-F CRISPR-associated protein Csy2 [Suttonella ornithocola]|uniref:CRISPR type I-F/YPEST-associated protein Csy2 n=1 Tax=Suttonella ornithocola TaxID=279832 RepID=A0A380MTJ7_9GAMM|nr:type I-F CRISPR-associated protein Csy2 [Suttonella ornithocola]SUO95041.1 CRISPR type I-F/YPEST-associated protein Csy2 [Suttonella ornithocola]
MNTRYPNHPHSGYLIIRNLRVENANTISGPLTYGFPALSGFVGAVHALSRSLASRANFSHLRLDGVLIACRDIQVQRYRENRYSNYTFTQTRNPILKDGSTAPIIESGRCHLTVHLAVKLYGDLHDADIAPLEQFIAEKIQQQRLAGGSVVGIDPKKPVIYCDTDSIDEHKKDLLPAFILMSAHQDLADITAELQQQNPSQTALDALIETAVIHQIPDENGQWHNESIKKNRGWLVPIPIGYQGISPIIGAGELNNSRNPEYPAQYVETIYSLGRWVFPNRIENLRSAFWQQNYDAAQNLYTIQQP